MQMHQLHSDDTEETYPDLLKKVGSLKKKKKKEKKEKNICLIGRKMREVK